VNKRPHQIKPPTSENRDRSAWTLARQRFNHKAVTKPKWQWVLFGAVMLVYFGGELRDRELTQVEPGVLRLFVLDNENPEVLSMVEEELHVSTWLLWMG